MNAHINLNMCDVCKRGDVPGLPMFLGKKPQWSAPKVEVNYNDVVLLSVCEYKSNCLLKAKLSCMPNHICHRKRLSLHATKQKDTIICRTSTKGGP